MDYYIENFEKVWNDNRYKILNLEIENLRSILFSEKLKNCSQQTVWQLIHDWVIVNKENRLTHLPKLLKENLQFDRLTKHYVDENIFQNVLFLLLPLNFQTDLKNFLKNVKFQDEPLNDSFNLPNLSPVINYCQQKLLCINTQNGYSEIYDQQHNSWYSSKLSLQLPAKQYFFELALLGSMLYAFGVDRQKDMKQSRREFSSVVLNDTIYALGGRDGKHPLRSCECYCSQLNEWSTVADMNIGRVNASAAVINGCIYVAGGWDGKRVVNSVLKYCPETDTWREVAPMTTARWRFALTPFAGRFWAIGGVGNDIQTLCNCESYDPVTDTWREEAPIEEGRCKHSAIEFNGELYVVGGGNKVEKENAILRLVDPILTVEKYLPSKGWIKSGTLQNNILHAKLIVVPSV